MHTTWPTGCEGPGRFPVDLRQAAERLAASKAARGLFGDAFVDHYRVEPFVGDARIHAFAQRLAARTILRDHLRLCERVANALRTLNDEIPMRIGILKTDSVREEFQSEFGDYPAMFRAMLMSSADDTPIEFRDYDVQARRVPRVDRRMRCVPDHRQSRERLRRSAVDSPPRGVRAANSTPRATRSSASASAIS